MSDKHKMSPDGLRDDGVRTDPVTLQDFMLYGQAQQALSQWTAPVLLHANNLHERLIVINMDGTGNDMVHDPEHITNVGLFNRALEFVSKTSPRVHAIYEVGPGTQKNVLKRVPDGALGYTHDAHIEHAYQQLIKQADKWLTEDPHADIRIAITGFSRGGDEAAGLARLIHERGIQDPSGMKVHHHLFSHDTITYTKPPLVPPGKTIQAMMLLDPVGTGIPYRRDRQLPSSVVSGLQITARDERRDVFASSEIIPNGLSVDGRFLQITVPGAHSDIGGSYHRNGLSTLNYNLAADYLNALSDTPLLHEKALPQDPSLFVIHHSEDHELFYTTRYMAQHSERAIRGAQRSAPDCRATIACLPPEPLDPSLATTLEARRPVTVGLTPQDEPTQTTAPTLQSTQPSQSIWLTGNTARNEPSALLSHELSQHPDSLFGSFAASSYDQPNPQKLARAALYGITPASSTDEMFEALCKAAEYDDDAGMMAIGHAHWHSPESQALQAEVHAHIEAQERVTQRAQPSTTQRLDDPLHPDHTMYRQAREGVHKLDQTYGRTTNVNSDMLAASLVVEARRQRFSAIHEVHLSADRQHVIARDTSSIHTALFRAEVKTLEGLNTPIEQSSQQWQQVVHERAQEQTRQKTQTQSRGMSR